MDVDFSQVGQNIAPLSAGVAQPRPAEVEASEDANTQSDRETNKVSGVAADSIEEVSSASVNIETAVAEISEFVQAQNRQLSFSIDEDSQRSVVRVTDSDSGEVIRQIPSEEVLALSERIKELQTDVGAAVGVLFNKQV